MKKGRRLCVIFRGWRQCIEFSPTEMAAEGGGPAVRTPAVDLWYLW